MAKVLVTYASRRCRRPANESRPGLTLSHGNSPKG